MIKERKKIQKIRVAHWLYQSSEQQFHLTISMKKWTPPFQMQSHSDQSLLGCNIL